MVGGRVFSFVTEEGKRWREMDGEAMERMRECDNVIMREWDNVRGFG